MKIQYLSDLHLEFHQDKGAAFLNEIVHEADILVIAGDLGIFKDMNRAFKFLSKKYKHIIYVAGNHEYYHSGPEETHELLNSCKAKFKNLHWLDNSAIEIKGQRFIGGTGWFPYRMDNLIHKCKLADFSYIRGFEPWVYEKNKDFVNLLYDNLTKNDIIVMHHLPSYNSVPAIFMHSELNRFFVCDITDLMLGREPRAVIHGHTHTSCTYKLEDTKILCNPFGYAHSVNKEFNNNAVLEV